MTSMKDPSASRPLSQHRLSIPSSQPANIPVRQSNSRHHSHSVSLGTVHNTHRITRRKSMSSNAANNAAAMAAALREAGDVPSTSLASHRRSLPSKKVFETASTSTTSGLGSYLAMSAAEESGAVRSNESGTANVDGHAEKPATKNRNRRASEGAHMFKGEGKRVSGEMRCDTCGKGYKHSSCLTKHMWEHDPAWAVTSKFLISKHQQVQLLEAASVLLNMNQDGPTPPETPRVADSDGSSASPTASGTSEMHEGFSSAETTPPPAGEDHMSILSPRFGNPKRQSSSSSVFSRSYQSAPSHPIFAGSAPSPGFTHYRHPSGDSRPTTSGTSIPGNPMGDEDEAGLAAAVELCNFGTPRSGPVHLPANIPPVPPLPARFLSPNNNILSGSAATPTVYNPLGMHPPMTHQISDERDVKMEEYDRHIPEDDDFNHRHPHADDDDDGVFGRMEE